MNLPELQTQFLNDVLSDASALESQLEPRFRHRLNIYRNNVRVGLKAYLADVFPAIKALVGDDFFNAFCQSYLETMPPNTGNLHEYGDAFATVLSGQASTSKLPYLYDVARLEWTYHQAYFADRGNPLTPPDNPNALLDTTARLTPSATLIESVFPIDELWRQSRPEYGGRFTVRLDDGGSKLLVLKPVDHVSVQRLDAASFQFLQGIESGQSFGESIESAMTRPGADGLTVFLSHCFNQRLFCQPE